MSLSLRRLPAALGLLLALVPSVGSASTGHLAAGAMCQGASATSLYYSTYGWAGNSSTSSTAYAICPIDRHSVTDTSFSASVYVYTYSSSYPVTCQLRDYTSGGSSGYMSTTSGTSSTGGYSTLTLASITSGSYYREMIYCSLSKSYTSSYTTSIQAYYISE